MHRILLVISLAVSPAFAQPKPSAAPAATSSNTLNLSVSQSKGLKVKGISRVSMTNPQVADAQFAYGADEVQVVGRREGETVLSIWSGTERVDYRVVVAAK